MQNICAAPNCLSSAQQQPLFRFPRDVERCKKWLENCHRKDLEDKSPEHLYRYYRLCAKHFDPSVIDSHESVTMVLKDHAIPTIFDTSSKPQKGPVKRTKDMTEDDATESKAKKKKTSDDTPTSTEEDEYREHLKSLFEVLLLLGEQNIPLNHPPDDKLQNSASSTFQALLEYHKEARNEAQKDDEKTETEDMSVSAQQLNQLVDVFEKCIRDKLLEEVRKSGSFSLVTDTLLTFSDEWHLPVFVRYVDQTNCQQEKFFGFLPFEGKGEVLVEKLLVECTETWGLNMEQCRGQAHSSYGRHLGKVKAFATKLTEKYPMAVLTPRSICPLNISLANDMALSGVQLVMSTFKKIDSFFSNSPSLQLELEHAISIFYQDKEEKANTLKEICKTNWTTKYDAFEVAVDIMESLLLCVDSVHDNEDTRWSDKITHDAFEISKALADFEFVMALVVLKNTLSLTRAFGKNLQGKAVDTYFAANSLMAVMHSLTEVHDNIDVYHEFWHDEAVSLAAALEIPVKVPRLFLRKHQSESDSEMQPYRFYKDHLTVPLVKQVIEEMKDLFNENHMKALKCLALVPAVMGQNKSDKPQEKNLDMYKNDIPNTGTLAAELECWWVKWSHKGKDDSFASTLQETLQLADVKFFPNMLAVLRVISTLPAFVLEKNHDEAFRRFKTYVDSTPAVSRSKGFAFLTVNYDVGFDLDSLVDAYIKMYPNKENA